MTWMYKEGIFKIVAMDAGMTLTRVEKPHTPGCGAMNDVDEKVRVCWRCGGALPPVAKNVAAKPHPFAGVCATGYVECCLSVCAVDGVYDELRDSNNCRSYEIFRGVRTYGFHDRISVRALTPGRFYNLYPGDSLYLHNKQSSKRIIESPFLVGSGGIEGGIDPVA